MNICPSSAGGAPSGTDSKGKSSSAGTIIAPLPSPWCTGPWLPVPSRRQVIDRLIGYAAAECADGTPLNRITRHILGLMQGLPGARAWRRHLSERAGRPGAGVEVIEQAAALVEFEPASRAA